METEGPGEKTMTKHVMPMTYQPKRDAVFNGKCTQTLRLGRKYEVGDSILIFEWSGKPYRSKWGRRVRVKVTDVLDCGVSDPGIVFPLGMHTPMVAWKDPAANYLALLDGIDPPTGVEWKRVIMSLNGLKTFGPGALPSQIVRWKP